MVNDSTQEWGQVPCSLVHTAAHQLAYYIRSGLQVEPPIHSESGSRKSVLVAVRSAVSGVYCTLPVVVVATVNGMDNPGERPFHYYCKQQKRGQHCRALVGSVTCVGECCPAPVISTRHCSVPYTHLKHCICCHLHSFECNGQGIPQLLPEVAW
jgi:hypothetical protein